MSSHRMPVRLLDIEGGNRKLPISVKIEQNPVFEQNLEFFFVLSALNYCKRSQGGLRFVSYVLRAF